MTETHTALTGAAVFWEGRLEHGKALLLEGGEVAGISEATDIPRGATVENLDGGTLSPGFVDLQVNGGGGVMFNSAPVPDTLRTMSDAHARIGATTILPTLITDTPEQTARAINAAANAVNAGIPGIAGLHLEGPHLAPARKGAHDAGLIRPMGDDDLQLLLQAAGRLPVLKVTLAPESATCEQIAALAQAGVLVSLGHTNADYAACSAATAAGAACVTHLFNAQSQIANREPGTVGAALALGGLSAGLIADGVHVHTANIETALRAKKGPGKIFLVSDAMATAGSEIPSFQLNGREIRRAGNRLTLADGTLAGAHLELADAIRLLVHDCSEPLEAALARATHIPAQLIGLDSAGRLAPGVPADLVHLSDSLELAAVWRDGRKL
jgi:N-acetylglucosamine-6-phosphate deacetylase